MGEVFQKPRVLIKWPHFSSENGLILVLNPTLWKKNPEKFQPSPLRKIEQ
jgi:hypothetical protein